MKRLFQILMLCLLLGFVPAAADDFCGGPPPQSVPMHLCPEHPGRICDCREHSLCDCSMQPQSPIEVLVQQGDRFDIALPWEFQLVLPVRDSVELPAYAAPARLASFALSPEPPPPRV